MASPASRRASVSLAVRAAARVGESPVWDAAIDRLVWVDIPAGLVHTSDIDSGETSTIRVDTLVGAVAPGARGERVVACREGFGRLADDGTFEIRQAVLPDGERMNDAKCDPAGRLWAGSTRMAYDVGRGALHVLQADWSTAIRWDGLTLPNGLGWSPDARTFYLADSVAHVIHAFDFDLAAGVLSRQRVLIEFAEADGLPDGLCVDDEGCIWVAMWGGGRVLQLSPSGKELTSAPLPVGQPSSCTFAGADLDVLCVTSARDGLTLDPDALDGSVFRIDGIGSQGLPQQPFGDVA